jgi:hypothetical protein
VFPFLPISEERKGKQLSSVTAHASRTDQKLNKLPIRHTLTPISTILEIILIVLTGQTLPNMIEDMTSRPLVKKGWSGRNYYLGKSFGK